MNEAEPKPKTDMDEYYEQSRRPLITQPKTPLGRIGCGAMLVVWFVLLSLPFGMLWLATGHDITINRGGTTPHASQYPFAQVHLIMDKDFRGLQFSTSRVVTNEETRFCYSQNINYLLWENRSGENVNTAPCTCFARDTIEGDWQALSDVSTDQCN